MHKLLLLSFLISTVMVPLACAREPEARRGLKKVLFFMVVFAVAYLFALEFIYPKLYYPRM